MPFTRLAATEMSKSDPRLPLHISKVPRKYLHCQGPDTSLLAVYPVCIRPNPEPWAILGRARLIVSQLWPSILLLLTNSLAGPHVRIGAMNGHGNSCFRPGSTAIPQQLPLSLNIASSSQRNPISSQNATTTTANSFINVFGSDQNHVSSYRGPGFLNPSGDIHFAPCSNSLDKVPEEFGDGASGDESDEDPEEIID